MNRSIIPALALTIVLAGCGDRGKVDKLEGQVAAYQQELAALRTQLADLQGRVGKLEAAAPSTPPAPTPPTPTPPTPTPPTPPDAACFAVRLDARGGAPINVIKVVRVITGKGLADTKALVDSAPVVILDKQPQETADAIVKQLKDAGADASLVPGPCT